MMGFLAFALPLALYFSRPSCMWNFDGVACAAALELGNPVFFFHANHLIYGAIGFLFWRFLVHPLTLMRALPTLQLLTSILSAIGLAGLYRLLSRAYGRPLLALGLTCVMACCAVMWVWSIEVQVYALGFLGLSWASAILITGKEKSRYSLTGFWHAVAVLGHVVNVLWVVPALYWIFTDPTLSMADRKKNFLRYLTMLGLAVVIPYFLVFFCVILPARPGTHWALTWLMGSAALTTNSRWQWHGAGWRGPLDWAYTTLSFFWGTFWPYGSGHRMGILVKAVTAITACGLSWNFFSGLKSKNARWRNFGLLWLGVFGLFWWTWEPSTECYRMAEAAPIAMLLLAGAESWQPERWALIYFTVMASLLLFVNWQTRVNPMSQSEQNIPYTQTVSLARFSPEKSLYLTEGGIPWMYLLYFTGRSALNIQNYSPERIVAEIQQHKRSFPVFVHSSALREEGAKTWLKAYHLKSVAEGLPWLQIE